jgi:hypothetical protein
MAKYHQLHGGHVMEKPQLPAARRFVDQIRALYAQDLGPNILWSKIKDAMGPLLADPKRKLQDLAPYGRRRPKSEEPSIL